MSEAENPAKPAAILILLREDDGRVEMFMAQRAQTMAFAAGMMTFPGGKVEAADAMLAADLGIATGFAELEPNDAAARVAAIRETFEEAGVLVSDGPVVDAKTRAEWLPEIAADAGAFGEFLRTIGHRLDAAKLTPWSRWCPPANLEKRRYDTRFYLAAMPEAEHAVHDGNESIESHWIGAGEALSLADAGKTAIIFPTRRNLERLAQCDRIDALIAHAATHPSELVQPEIELRDGKPWLCIPEGLGYPVTAEPIKRAMRG